MVLVIILDFCGINIKICLYNDLNFEFFSSKCIFVVGFFFDCVDLLLLGYIILDWVFFFLGVKVDFVDFEDESEEEISGLNYFGKKRKVWLKIDEVLVMILVCNNKNVVEVMLEWFGLFVFFLFLFLEFIRFVFIFEEGNI